MKIIRLQQGTPEWHRWRLGGLGGSDVAAILNLCPYEDASPESVLVEKVEGKLRPATFAMRRGQRLEYDAREAFERRTGWRFAPACVQHDDESWMRSSLDGLMRDGAVPQLLEIKAPKWTIHDEVLAGMVPEHFLVQCQWQLLVTGADVCHLVSFSLNEKFRPVDRLAHVVVESDPERQAEILDEARDFWARVCDAREGKAVAVA